MIRLTILGVLASKKNRRVTYGVMSKEARAFQRDFHAQVPRSARRALGSLTRLLRATVTVYYPSMRSDLDCSLLYDCLQEAGVVANDRYIRVHMEVARIDKKNPRVEVEISEL